MPVYKGTFFSSTEGLLHLIKRTYCCWNVYPSDLGSLWQPFPLYIIRFLSVKLMRLWKSLMLLVVYEMAKKASRLLDYSNTEVDILVSPIGAASSHYSFLFSEFERVCERPCAHQTLFTEHFPFPAKINTQLYRSRSVPL